MRRLIALVAACATLGGPAQVWAKTLVLYAGSYTSGPSRGIYGFRFDERTGALTPLGLVAATPQPAHIWASPEGQSLYSVNWEEVGGVSAFRVGRGGRLSFLNRVSTKGALPNQVVVDPSGRIAVAVNYGSGNLAAFRIGRDGRLSDAIYTDPQNELLRSTGQSRPRAHGVVFSKDGRLMYAAQLGLDRVYTYRVDAARGSIHRASPPFIEMHAGAGPRRLQLSPDDRFLYVNHETDSEVSVFATSGQTLREVQSISTLPPSFDGPNSTAEMVISPDGRHLYVGNRGHDSVAIFAVDCATGRLTLKGEAPSGGRTPRNLRFDPSGRYLVVANENGDNIVVFKVERSTGGLSATGGVAQVSKPGGMYFVPVDP